MKIYANTLLTNLYDVPYKEDGKVITLRAACLHTLVTQLKGDDELTGEQKFKMHELALKLKDDDEPNLKSEEIALLKERADLAYPSHIMGPVWTALENPTPPASPVLELQAEA